MKNKVLLIVFLIIGIAFNLFAQQGFTYQKPPQAIIDLVDAPSTPQLLPANRSGKILILSSPELPSIADLASTELRLAGIRIDPATNGPSRSAYSTGIQIMDADGKNLRRVIGLPVDARLRNFSWSADEKHVAFTHTSSAGIELWLLNIAEANAKRLSNYYLNEVLRDAINWFSDGERLLFKVIPDDRGVAPQRKSVAAGPMVQESLGRRAAVRTFQDLLRDADDERLFEFYATSQLIVVDLNGTSQKFNEPGLIGSVSISPDGNYILLTRFTKPYSYIVPFNRFPQNYELLNADGSLLRILAQLPVSDNLPQGFDAVRTGMRNAGWRADAAAVLFWVEALDNGDPAAKSTYRDQLYFLKAPFVGEPIHSANLSMRFGGITWGKNDFAIITEYWRKDRRLRVSSFNPDFEKPEPIIISDRSSEDRYNDPGRFLTTTNAYGFELLLFDRLGQKLFLSGQGASSEGNRPFVDSYDIKSGKTQRIFQSQPPWHEIPVKLIDPDKMLLITRRESVNDNPNFYLRNLRRNHITQLTFYPDPMPGLQAIRKEMIRYERKDGIALSGTLYLPTDFKPGIDAPLPTLLWAYPNEFKSADAAGQVSGSPYTYTRLGASSAVMLATQGYAVLNDASFPILGEGEKEPNDTFIQQLADNAEAAIQKLVEMKVTDPKRVAVSGHSYGAFMTANLLTHTNLFAAGIARSGAYNRSLTPFGFQGEERNYWQAQEVYHQMSPFMYADKMKTPMLLIHGADDNNSGTFPMQTERYYDALRGLGATVRMVLLPHESHGYRARESVLHMHWEWLRWMEMYVKEKK